jgi:hypothetical protein
MASAIYGRISSISINSLGGFSQESSTLLQKTNSRGGRDACPGFAWTVRLAAEGGKVYSPDEVW